MLARRTGCDLPRPRSRWLGRFALAWLYVGVVFNFNVLSTASIAWFHTHQFNSDDLVWARLHRFAEAPAWPGLWQPRLTEDCQLPLAAVRPHSLFPASPYEAAWLYAPACLQPSTQAYTSQVGVQGVAMAAAFSWFAEALQTVPRPSGRAETVTVYALQGVRTLQGTLSAAVVAMVLAWLGAAMGDGAFVVGTLAISLSPWLVVFARSVYWQLDLLLLPFATAAHVQWGLARREGVGRWHWALPGWCLVAGTVALKCLAGYEYVSTIIVACAVPVVYHCLQARRRWWLEALLGCSLCGAAALAVLLYHGDILGGGNTRAGLRIICERAAARTYPGVWNVGLQGSADAALAERSSWLWNIVIYVFGARTYAGWFMPFVLWLAGFTWAAWRSPERRTACTVLAASLLAPVSWFVLAKGHSAAHPHLNYVLWHIPMTFIGWGLVGQALERWLRGRAQASSR